MGVVRGDEVESALERQSIAEAALSGGGAMVVLDRPALNEGGPCVECLDE